MAHVWRLITARVSLVSVVKDARWSAVMVSYAVLKLVTTAIKSVVMDAVKTVRCARSQCDYELYLICWLCLVFVQVESSLGWTCTRRSLLADAAVLASTFGQLCVLPTGADAQLYSNPNDTSLQGPQFLCSASACSKCGNGILEAAEVCDDGMDQFAVKFSSCNSYLLLSQAIRYQVMDVSTVLHKLDTSVLPVVLVH